MPAAVLTEVKSADAAPPPLPMTRFQAQRKLGLVAPLDYTIAALMVFAWMTLGFWRLFGSPTAIQLISFAIINVALTQIWLIVLAYRVMVFIMDLGADINLMPEAASRIVLGYWEGRGR
jgi:hypothetical protein